MKNRVMWMLMVCGMASIGIVPLSEADFLSDLLANPPQAPYVDRQGVAARAGGRTALEKRSTAYRDARPQSRTVLITPQGPSLRHHREIARSGHVAAAKPRSNVAMRPRTNQALASNLRPASAPHVATRPRVASRPAPAVRGRHAYQRNYSPRVQPPLTAPVRAAASDGLCADLPSTACVCGSAQLLSGVLLSRMGHQQ